jgi:DNA repair exonuclease SbcCD ATPase subunit
MDDHTSSFNYLGEEMLLNQFSILAENIQKTLPPGHEGSQRIADQSSCLKTKRERWPGNFLNVWQSRILPVFSTESITKLNQRQKESLRSDINRKKNQLDYVENKRERTIDNYDSNLLTCRRELSFHRANSFEYAQLEAKMNSAHDACQNSLHRLSQNEHQLRQDLTAIERDFHPIRLLSTQSNQKNLICPKQNSYLGLVPINPKH